MKQKRFTSKEATLDSTEEGTLEAIFSVFDVEDRDGDVVKASAIEDGKEIPLVWHHDWEKPIGKGIIVNDGKQAIFKGSFFLDTDAGLQAYRSVKNMGSLQQYSWGFAVEEQEKGKLDDKVVNFITKTEAFEVSPVLVGSNRLTSTTAIKSAEKKGFYGESTITGSFEEKREKLRNAFKQQQFGAEGDRLGFVAIVATFDSHFIGMLYKWSDEEASYWDITYELKDDDFELGEPTQVQAQTEFVPVQASGKSMDHTSHTQFLQVAIAEYVKRSNVGSALRSKDGRAISENRRNEIVEVTESMKAACEQLQSLIKTDTAETVDGMSLFIEFQKIIANNNGVNV